MIPYPVQDGAAFLAGSWRLRRLAWDGSLGRLMRLAGTAAFSPHPDGLLFEERGRMRLGAFESETRQSYLFCRNGDGSLTVRFADGRLFHGLDLSRGRASVEHWCSPDLYRGRYRVAGPDRWTVSWRITGPRKDLVLVSRFTRG